MLVYNQKQVNQMLKMNTEFRKGVLFIRLIGNLTKDNYLKKEKEVTSLRENIGLKYIVINLDEITSVDLNCLNDLINYYQDIKNNNEILFICEQKKVLSTKLLKNQIPSINKEIEVFNLI